MFRSMRPTKYSSDFGTTSHQGAKTAQKRPKMAFWGPVGQTGSRNMAATRQINFLTLVSYSTLNTFGGHLAPLRLYPRETLPLAHCKQPPDQENILSPALWKFEIPYLSQMESDSLRIKTIFVRVLRPIILTCKMRGITLQRGQTQKVPRPQKILNPQFWGLF